MSRGFRTRWEAERLDEALSEVVLQPRLREIVHAPLVKRADGLLLEPLVTYIVRPECFQDRTCYEAFVNRFYVDDYLDELGVMGDERMRVLFEQGARAALELAERLGAAGAYRVLLSLQAELPTMTLRFFKRRPSQLWGSDDPDALQLEDVFLVDTGW